MRKRFLLPVLFLTITTIAESSPFRYINVGDTTTPIPGGQGTFIDVDLPAVTNGFAVYAAQGTNGQDGIYRYDLFGSGGLQTVVDINTPEPGGTGTFLEFFGNSAYGDYVAFLAAGTTQAGIYLEGHGDIHQIVDLLDEPVPGGTGTFVPNMRSRPYVHDGVVVFNGYGSDGEEGIYVWEKSTGDIRVIADTNTPIPGGTGNFTSFAGASADPDMSPTVRDGKVVFFGRGDNQNGIYLAESGAIEVVADRNTTIPGTSANFLILSQSQVAGQAEGDRVIFLYNFSLYAYENGVLSVYVPAGTLLPTGDPNDPIQELGVGATQGFGLSGGVASFLAELRGGPANQGVFTGLPGSLTPVIVNGDFINGVPVAGFGTYGNGIDQGLVAFNGNFIPTAVNANFVAVPVAVPLPATTLLLGVGLAAMRARRRIIN